MITNDDVTLSPRLAGQVKRYHVWPTLHAQSVGEHTWQVMRLYIELWGLPSAQVLYRILHHDTAEVATGDLPFRSNGGPGWETLKRAMKTLEHETLARMRIELYPLTDEERTKIKIADLLEMHEFGAHEAMLGNQYGGLICENVGKAALELAPDYWNKVETWLVQHPWHGEKS